METTDAVVGLGCRACGTTHPADTVGHCPACDGPLAVRFDPGDLTRDALVARDRRGLARFAGLLPFRVDRLDPLEAGDTPLLALDELGEGLGVGSLAVKDEARNPTGALADRAATLTVAAAREVGASAVALPSPGNGAQAVAASAARAGLDSHAFVPSRTPFVNKAMINVHGGEMTVVPGRFADALAAYEEAMAEADWFPAAGFATAYPLEGVKTVAFELLAQRGWTVPDAVVVPVGHGTGLVGIEKGFRELVAGGLIDEEPRLFAVQPAGCAPIASSWTGAGEAVTPVEGPDTICGELEIPDPRRGRGVLEALSRTDGGAVAVPDEAILEAATSLAAAGPTVSVSGGAALAGASALAEGDALGADADVVLVNPLSGNKEADILRSHLMSKGI